MRDLGVTMSANLSWESHIGKVGSRVRSSAIWVMSVLGRREEEVMMTLYNSFVHSQLEYCSLLWHPQKIGDIEVIEGIQRAFTSRISAVSQFDHWEKIRRRRLMCLQRCRESFMAIWMFKCHLGEVPNDLGIEFRSSRWLGIQAVVPPLQRNRNGQAQAKYEESVAVISLRLRNVLLEEISMMDCPHTFRRVLTEWFLKRPDRPSVAGYRFSDDNYIVYCRSFRCLFRLVKNWTSLPLCCETFLSKRGERFKDTDGPSIPSWQTFLTGQHGGTVFKRLQ